MQSLSALRSSRIPIELLACTCRDSSGPCTVDSLNSSSLFDTWTAMLARQELGQTSPTFDETSDHSFSLSCLLYKGCLLQIPSLDEFSVAFVTRPSPRMSDIPRPPLPPAQGPSKFEPPRQATGDAMSLGAAMSAKLSGGLTKVTDSKEQKFNANPGCEWLTYESFFNHEIVSIHFNFVPLEMK
jgi:hypothetical protein